MANVLIADREPEIRASFSAALGEAGHQVVRASNSAEARALVDQQQIDVAVVDVLLDGDAGLVFARHLRDSAPDMPVILVDDELEIRSAIAAIHLRVFDYLGKSLGKEQLVDVVHRAVEEKRSRVGCDARPGDEERFRLMFRNHEAVMLLIEPESGQIVDANRAAEGLYGYSLDELRSLCIDDINCLSPAQVRAERTRGAMRQQNYFVFQHRLRSGDIRTVEIHSTPIDLAGGHFLFSIVHDATARHKAEAALRELEERYRIMVEQAGVGIGFWTPDGKVISMNDMAARYMDAPSQQLVGKTAVELFGADLGSIVVWRITESVRERRVREYTDAVVLSAAKRWFVSTYAPVSDGAGTLQGVLVVSHDITKRRQAEEALNESQQREMEAIRAANVGLWDWDLATNRVRYSAEWKRQLGYQQEEISDSLEEWRSRVHQDDLPGAEERIRELTTAASQRQVVEFRLRHKDGSYRWILAQASVCCDQAGHVIRVMGSHIDITERKRMEEELKRHRDNLEDKVRERTRELRVIVNAMAGREVRMAELKNEIAALEDRLWELEP